MFTRTFNVDVLFGSFSVVPFLLHFLCVSFHFISFFLHPAFIQSFFFLSTEGFTFYTSMHLTETCADGVIDSGTERNIEVPGSNSSWLRYIQKIIVGYIWSYNFSSPLWVIVELISRIISYLQKVKLQRFSGDIINIESE